ncbi:hypothetical protein BD324DRAFT_584838 [Kockovaella imperatae]|uniref:BRCT domain-containing protein n=1 Tax=Kockovaella imperatae TaxID=4999 RepID=A0A1Y1U6F5_9TREE|nr:hypothetical protein BD324DRAFT_584838 [Kockovaella imperatae]ORX33582.1 hypothetical protein BD324DRAFT_584838 [Kockovaella imperatae]
MVSSGGQGCMKRVVAFVDVRTAEGDEAGVIFSDMLRSLGARVISRLTDNVTHVIYKSGRQTTLSWWRRQDEETRPFIVGIGWVTKSKEKGEKLDEGAFAVNVEDEDVFSKVSKRERMQEAC